MTGDTFIAANHRIDAERRAKYCGTASIRVASLRFRDAAQTTKRSHQNAESLKRVFLEERGCRREDSRHHAKAIVSQQTLEAALADSNVSVASLLEDNSPYPQLSLPDGVSLECIQGRDRLTAADEVLHGENNRWVVDLFLDDLSEELRRMLTEDYDYQKRPDDGEIYVKIREYQGFHGRPNAFFERMWLGRLAVSENRRKNFDQLSRHRKLVGAFDALLDIPALFGGFRLSVVHQLISMKCDEPNLFYLKQRIYKWWHDLCDGDLQTMRRIDRVTVEAVQGKAPGACKADHEELLNKVRSGHILGEFTPSQRETLWSRMCSNSERYLIPSLFTFFEDRKYLARAADCLRRLVDVGPRDTIVGRLEESFTDANQQSDRCVVQISNLSFGTIPGDAGTRIDLGIRHLWLAAIRDHQELPSDPRKRDLLAKARATADDTTLYELASLAHRIGFESNKISGILKNAPDRQIAERALLAARKPGRYRYQDRERCIQQIADIFATATTVEDAEVIEVSDIVGRAQSPRRQGVPHELDHERDKASLFFPSMESVAGAGQTKISSLFIRKSMYTAYFGEPPSTTGCIPCSEVATSDIDMRDQVSSPVPSQDPDRVNLDLAMIRHGLNWEQGSSVDGPSLVDDDGLGFENLTPATDDERAKLDRLRQLTIEEQVRIDEKRKVLNSLVEEEEDLRRRLNQLAESENEAQTRLDHLLDRLEEEQVRQSDLPLVRREDSVIEVVQTEAADEHAAEEIPPKTHTIAKSRRNNRGTHFAFGRLLEGGKDDDLVNANVRDIREDNASSGESLVRIEFKEWQTDGSLRTTDTLNVSDPSHVERVAGKYVRKGFSLFDVHNNNLNARNCFRQVTSDGSNTVILKDLSRINHARTGTATQEEQEEQEGKRPRGDAA